MSNNPTARADTVEFEFEDLVAGYLEDYELHGYRAIKSARSRVAQLGRRFAGSPARAITAPAIRQYQLERRRAGAATGTTNSETSALRRMFRLAIRCGHLPDMPTFPDRLTESPPRQGFFEQAEYSVAIPSRTRRNSGRVGTDPTCSRHVHGGLPARSQFGDILVGSDVAIPFNAEEILSRLRNPGVQAYYRRAGIDLETLLAPYLKSAARLPAASPGHRHGDLNEDLFPRDEFSAPRHARWQPPVKLDSAVCAEGIFVACLLGSQTDQGQPYGILVSADLTQVLQRDLLVVLLIARTISSRSTAR
jgi:hypothetical protein